MSLSHYKAEVPPGVDMTEIVQFYEKFYSISDTRGANEDYVSFFTSDGTLIMGPKGASGAKDMLAMRKGMWTGVEKRKHQLKKLYPFGNPPDGVSELMLHGEVSLSSRMGRLITWTGPQGRSLSKRRVS